MANLEKRRRLELRDILRDRQNMEVGYLAFALTQDIDFSPSSRMPTRLSRERADEMLARVESRKAQIDSITAALVAA